MTLKIKRCIAVILVVMMTINTMPKLAYAEDDLELTNVEETSIVESTETDYSNEEENVDYEVKEENEIQVTEESTEVIENEEDNSETIIEEITEISEEEIKIQDEKDDDILEEVSEGISNDIKTEETTLLEDALIETKEEVVLEENQEAVVEKTSQETLEVQDEIIEEENETLNEETTEIPEEETVTLDEEETEISEEETEVLDEEDEVIEEILEDEEEIIEEETETLEEEDLEEENESLDEEEVLEEETEEEQKEELVPFEESQTIDGVIISVKAEEGTFPKDSTLSIRKVDIIEEAKVEEAIQEQREDNKNVVSSYTFDIKVLDKDGNEIQPAEGKKVEVSFKLAEVLNTNLETNVYHIDDQDNVTSLDIQENEDTAIVETDGFSYYTVEFTYNNKQYVLNGDSEVSLREILDYVGINGNPSAAVSSNPELFYVVEKNGELFVVAKKPFKSDETLTVTVEGVDYEIKVTDEVTIKTSELSGIDITLNEGDTLIVDTDTTTKYNLYIEGDNVTVTINPNCQFNIKNVKASGTKAVTYTIDKNNFTLNLYEGAKFSYSKIQRVYLEGDNTTINIYGNTDSSRGFDMTQFYFRGQNAKLNIDSTSTEQYALYLYVDNGGSLECNIYGTMYNSAPSTRNIFSVNGNGKCVANVYGTLKRKITTNNDCELTVIGKSETAKIEQFGGDMQIGSSGKLIKIKDITWTSSYSGGTKLLYAVADENIVENVTVKDISIAGTTDTSAFIIGDNTVFRNVVVDLPDTVFNRPLIDIRIDIEVLFDGCRFENLKNGEMGLADISYRTTTTLKDTIITNCESGIKLEDNTTGTIDKLSGVLIFSGDTIVDKNENYNIYLGNSRAFTVADDFSGVAGVTTKNLPTEGNPIQISTDGTQHVANVFSDKEGYSVGIETGTSGDHHVLMVHDHEWTFNLGKTKTDNDTLMVWCAPILNPICLYHWEEGAEEDSRVKLIIDTIDGETKYKYDENNPIARPAKLKNVELFTELTDITIGEIKYYDGEGTELNSAPIEIGNYTAKAVVTHGSDSYTIQTSYSIKGPGPVPEPTNPTYNGQEQNLVSIENSGEVNVLYRTSETGEWTETIPTGVDAGTYDVWYMYEGDEESIEKVDGVTIKEADITITADNKTSVYGSDLETFTYKVTQGSVATGDELKIAYTTGASKTANVGEYDIVPDWEIENTNYDVTFENGIYTITQREITIDWDNLEFTYDKQSHIPTASANGLVGTDTCTVTVEGEQTNADTYTATVTGIDNDNYKLADTAVTSKEFTIAKAKITVSGITAQDKVYDGNTEATLVLDNAVINGKVENDDLSFTGSTGTFSNKNVENDKTVTISNVTLSGNDAANYELTSQPEATKANITKRPVTISGITAQDKLYDGNTDATLVLDNAVINGKVENDDLSFTGSTGTFSDKNVENDKTVTITGVTLSGNDAANYELTSQPETTKANITKRPVTISGITAEDKVYDGNTEATLVYDDVILDGKLVDDDLSVSATGTFADKNVGTDKTVTISGSTLTGDAKDNYVLASEGHQETTKASITKREITVSGIISEGKVYDGNNIATDSLYYGDAKLIGKVDGEGEYCDDKLGITATGTFEDEDYGVDKTITFTSLALTGSEANNYKLAETDQQDSCLGDIDKYAVTVTAINATKVYGEDDPEFEYEYEPELVEGDEFEGELSRHAGEDVGEYTITAGTLHDQNHNYAITYNHATLTITQAPNSATVSIEGWTYGDEVNEPSVTADFGVGTATYTYSNAKEGTYTETVPTAAGTYYVKATIAETKNYKGAVSEPVEFVIAKKVATLNWTDTTFTYDGETHKPTATVTNLETGDSCDVTVTGEQTNAGTYTATASELSNGNYELPENKTTEFTIAKRQITVSGIEADKKTYDKTKDATLDFKNVVLDGNLDGENLSITAKGEFVNADAGMFKTVNITDLELTGPAKDNYVLASEGQQTTTEANILKKYIYVKAVAASKIYGEDDPELTYTYEPELFEGDSFTGSLIRDKGEDVKQYNIMQGSLSAGNNYSIVYTTALFTINEAKITIKADDKTSVYGDEIEELSYTVSEGKVKEGDELKIAYTTDASKTANVGEYDIVPDWEIENTNYDVTFESGIYTITQREAELEWKDIELIYNGKAQKPSATVSNLINEDKCEVTIDGDGTDVGNYIATAKELSNPNYQLPNETTKEFSIVPKEIKVSGITAQDKIYDGNTEATLNYENVILEDRVDEDDITVKAIGTFEDKNAGQDKVVNIINLELIGKDKDNYILATNDQQVSTTASINKKSINISAEEKNKYYGEKDPELTYILEDELVEGDNIKGSLVREIGEDVNDYNINIGTLTAGNNYEINYSPNIFKIMQVDNNVEVSITGWTYGDNPNKPIANADFGEDNATFIYSDSIDGTYIDQVPTDAGTYYVKANIEETNNYKGATSEAVEFIIDQKEVELEWKDIDLIYNGQTQKPNATIKGLVGTDECEAIITGEQINAGKYIATASQLNNPNYKLSNDVTKEFIINPKELTKDMLNMDSDTIKNDGTNKGPNISLNDDDLNITISNNDYILSGDITSDKSGTYNFHIEGKGNYKGNISSSWVMYDEKTNNDIEKGEDGKGDLEIFADIVGNTENIAIDNFSTDLAKKLLSEEDLERYNNGEKVLVYIELFEIEEDDVISNDKDLIMKDFEKEDITEIRWFNITIWKKIGNDEASMIHDTPELINIIIDAPEEFKNVSEDTTRTFYLARAHENVVDILNETDDIHILLSSNKFSIYSIGYKDIVNKKDDSKKEDESGEKEDGGNKKRDERRIVPNTSAK